MFVRRADASFTLANFMRTHLYSALATLKIGLEILEEEHVAVDRMYGHGGFFTTKGVGQSIMAAVMNAPVFVMETAGEGGAWGIGLLAAYMRRRTPGETLDAYLEQKVFKDAAEAVHNAVVLEEVAKMAFRTEVLQPSVTPAPDCIRDKHFFRKHGENAYYGQRN